MSIREIKTEILAFTYELAEQLVLAVTRRTIFSVLFVLVFLPCGCATTGRPKTTFSKQVAPVLFAKCVKCHRPGEIGAAVPLLSYDAVRPRADLIKQKVLAREMPPWPADPMRSMKFRNDARLSQQDIDAITAWVDGGAPKVNDADLPLLPVPADGWLHPQGLKPDLVISLPGEFHAPDKGVIPYLRFLAKVPFSEDKWIVASQTRAGNPALVHHMAITEIPLPEGMGVADFDAVTTLAQQLGFRNSLVGARPVVTAPSNSAVFDMLGMYTPGTTFEMYGNDAAKLLKGGKNMYLNFNIHYQTTGKPETDRSMIAFWFQPGPPKHQLFRVPGAGETIIANGKELLTDTPGTKAEGTRVTIPPIPPYAENYEVIGVTGYAEPVTIYQLQPHAHYRGKDFTYTVVYPDGREESVLSVPRFDHRWQLAYEFETPLKLPAGSKLVVTAHYDNSRKNVHNPAPDKEVYFRDQNQSWDEMFTPFIQYTIDSQDLTQPTGTVHPDALGLKSNTSQRQEKSKQGVLEIAEVVGCLEENHPGEWMLSHASDPGVSGDQSTSSVALRAAKAKPLGNRRYRLLGASVFNPSSHTREKVAVKGVLIENTKERRLNVTSLQMVVGRCTE